jgi:malate dehydrogenase (oxaloacetate-decarboxylating)(NADP+)
MDQDLRRAALAYHQLPRPGKLSVQPTKAMQTERDLSLAYSPGVATACQAIVANPNAVWDYTTRGNLVAVVSNGTAVLGGIDIQRSQIMVAARCTKPRKWMALRS